jgi:hypothetical protein
LFVMIEWLREIRAAHAGGVPVVIDQDAADPPAEAEAAGIVAEVPVDTEWWRHFNERCAHMTWRLAQHSREWVAFVERDGGLFLMADADSEVRAVDALYRVGVYLPFGDANVSWFRRLLADVPHQELDVFMEQLLADDERWPPNCAAWLGWATDLLDSGDVTAALGTASPSLMAEQEDDIPLTITATAPAEPVSMCGRWLAAAEELISLVEADWFRVADWYRRTGGTAAATRRDG